jgi:hypothetical protein
MSFTPAQIAALAAGAILLLWPMIGPKLAAYKASLVPSLGKSPKLPAAGHERALLVTHILELQDAVKGTSPKAATLLGHAAVELIGGPST